MVGIVVVTRAALLIARRASTWTIDEHLGGRFRSDDAGRSWKALDLPWPEPGLEDGVEALACLPE